MNLEPLHPTLRKQSISQYITTECDRQLALELWRKHAESQGMPPRLVPRSGLEIITQEGRAWELKKVRDLAFAFPDDTLVGRVSVDVSGEVTRWTPIPLDVALDQSRPGSFLVEAVYSIGPTFINAHGLDTTAAGLRYADLRPDLIQVLPASSTERMVDPEGKVVAFETDDQRLGLRVIDIKFTAEPSRGHFAEVAYYACALAAWLVDAGLDSQYVAVDTVALWPGSHDASSVRTAAWVAAEEGRELGDDERLTALAEDFESVPFEVMALRLRRFFEKDLPRALVSRWSELDWHVDGRCRNCDWLGQRWVQRDGTPNWDDDHCIPTAERIDHLSRVAFMPRGASASLRERGINTVTELAALDSESPAFADHQSLRSNRGVLAGRAESLVTDVSGIPAGAGTSAIMPRWVDLRVRLSVDFDVGSATSLAFAAEANWVQPYRSRQGQQAKTHTYRFRHFTVQDRSLDAERERLVAFLNFVSEILADAHTRDPTTTYQVFIWDRVQYDHLVRVIGRHLPALLGDQQLKNLVWLFPPEEVAPNPKQNTRNSPLCIVRDVVRAVVGAPLPHYYSLLSLARTYWPSWVNAEPTLSVHPLFEDPLSDQIPSERAHEIWSRSTGRRDWQDAIDQLTEALRVRLLAMRFVVDRLTEDLGDTLKSHALQISLTGLPPDVQNKVSFDGQLWYAFARLNAALEELDVHQGRAMPLHEREARFLAARLPRRLYGARAEEALTTLGLPRMPRRRVYELADTSHELKAKAGDFGWSLAPGDVPHFLDSSIWRTSHDYGLSHTVPGYLRRRTMDEITAVTISGLDRDHGLIAVDMSSFEPVANMFDAFEEAGALDLEADVVLDRRPTDFFTRRLLETLKAIGNPRVAADNPNQGVLQAMGMEGRRGARRTGHSATGDVLWIAATLASAEGRLQPEAVLAAAVESGIELNDSQQRALKRACSRRLSLVWGPPGTGKSRTLCGLIVGATRASESESFRILICGPTYTATDNVFDPVRRHLAGRANNLLCARVRSVTSTGEGIDPNIDYPLARSDPDQRVRDLRERLESLAGPTIVSTVPQQVHNLLAVDGNQPVGELFDLIVIDEASQLDVAHAVLAIAALADGGTVVIAGDHLQLPPIHQATAPLGLETMVGSIYNYFHDRHGIEPSMLDINYRSNATIVDFVKTAGYRTTLTAHNPTLRLHPISPLDDQTDSWPTSMTWSPDLPVLADPRFPISCFVYAEGRSSQWNHFEAETTAALVRLYWRRIAELTAEGDPIIGTPPTATHFFAQSVGVVTPHRAQQSLVISYLTRAFVNSPDVTTELIRGCVDTVERFQGQERDVIIATFALGDPDSISDEDEFLLSLNRFNVMASRARAKLIVIVSDEVTTHLSRDPAVLRESVLLKRLVHTHCDIDEELVLNHTPPDSAILSVVGRHRAKRSALPRWP